MHPKNGTPKKSLMGISSLENTLQFHRDTQIDGNFVLISIIRHSALTEKGTALWDMITVATAEVRESRDM